MIIDELKNLERFHAEIPFLGEIVNILQSGNLGELNGAVSFGELKIVAIEINDHKCDDLEKLEYHRKFHDFHVSLNGEDMVAVPSAGAHGVVVSEYIEAEDYGFVNYEEVDVKAVPAGRFAFIPANLPHMALYKNHSVQRKVVIKIPVQKRVI